MPHAHNGDIEIYYETRGSDRAPALIFVHGFTVQMIGWRDEFLDRFVEQGFRVIQFDNRDVGLSTMTGGPDDIDGGYSVHDMAADVIAVLDDLGIEAAHMVGQSMGGMVVQQVAIDYPDRIRSLNILYSAPSSERKYFVEHDEKDLTIAQEALAREDAIRAHVDRERISSSPDFPFEEEWITEFATRSYDRRYRPDGFPRQAAAMHRSEDRLPGLREVRVPTSIIHGLNDGHLTPLGAIDMHSAITGSELHLYAGMGHELPTALWDDYVLVIARTVRRGEALVAEARNLEVVR